MVGSHQNPSELDDFPSEMVGSHQNPSELDDFPSEMVGSRRKSSEKIGNRRKSSEEIGGASDSKTRPSNGVGEIMTANGMKSADDFKSWMKGTYRNRNKGNGEELLDVRRQELEAHIRKHVISDTLRRFIKKEREVVGEDVYLLLYKDDFSDMLVIGDGEGSPSVFEFAVGQK
jgi:hypothetical protein